MNDAGSLALAGLPRLAPLVLELRRRGQAALALAVCVALFTGAGWLLDQPLDLRRTLFGVAAAGPLSVVGELLVARARLRDGQEVRPPPGMAVYETTADGRDRHSRAAMLAILAVVSLLALDRFTGGMGTMAGLMAGLLGAVGAVDLYEAGAWARLGRERHTRLYLLLPGGALIAGAGRWRVYQLPAGGEIGQDGVPRGNRTGAREG